MNTEDTTLRPLAPETNPPADMLGDLREQIKREVEKKRAKSGG